MTHHIEHMTHRVAKWFGSTSGFVTGVISIVLWVVIGKFYAFSPEWEQALSIYISLITFFMLFVLQRAQSKELAAIHIKLNELIITSQKADNHIVAAEHMAEQEIHELQEEHRKIGTDED